MDPQEHPYLIAAYNEKNATVARIRARIFGLVQSFVLGAFAISGFLITIPDISFSGTQILLASLAIAIMTIAALHSLSTSYRALFSIQKIVAQIERAMGFHETGVFLQDAPLFPQDVASADVLETGTYERPYQLVYSATLILAALLTIAVLMVSQLSKGQDVPAEFETAKCQHFEIENASEDATALLICR